MMVTTSKYNSYSLAANKTFHLSGKCHRALKKHFISRADEGMSHKILSEGGGGDWMSGNEDGKQKKDGPSYRHQQNIYSRDD